MTTSDCVSKEWGWKDPCATWPYATLWGASLCAGACSIAGSRRRADNIFLGDLALLPELGLLLWPRLAGAYIQRYLAPLLPSDHSDMAAFDQVAPAFVSVFADIVAQAHTCSLVTSNRAGLRALWGKT